jgi:effector-binding domain-containing protein
MPDSEPTVKIIPAIRVMFKRGIGPVPQIIVSLVQDIIGQVNSAEDDREKVQIAGYPMIIYHDPPERIDINMADIEVAFPVAGNGPLDPAIGLKTMPEHKVVSVMHTGPYSECEGGYAKAIGYIARNGLTAFGPFREIYMNSPEEVPESQLLTEIQVPVV